MLLRRLKSSAIFSNVLFPAKGNLIIKINNDFKQNLQCLWCFYNLFNAGWAIKHQKDLKSSSQKTKNQKSSSPTAYVLRTFFTLFFLWYGFGTSVLFANLQHFFMYPIMPVWAEINAILILLEVCNGSCRWRAGSDICVHHKILSKLSVINLKYTLETSLLDHEKRKG